MRETKTVIVELECRGTTPLLMCAASIEKIFGGRTRSPDKSDKEEAEELLWKDLNGEPCIPSYVFFGCLKGAGRSVKFDGKRNVSTTKGTLLPRFLKIRGEHLLLLGSKKWEVDRKMGRDPKGNPIPAIRPRFDDWGFAATLKVNISEVSLPTVRRLVELAGVEAGIGGFRPSRGGYYGQFEIVKWEVQEDGKPVSTEEEA